LTQPPAASAYPGSELELFRDARRWKRYVAGQIAHALTGHVLEVGAGIGGLTRVLRDARQECWTALEPDPRLATRIREDADRGHFAAPVDVRDGTLADLGADERFDAILYADVLEHIEDDVAELAAASAHLRAGGALVVIVPAHAWLFSEFDRAIGHHRRYDAAGLRAVAPPDLELRLLRQLDSVGILASLANRLLLRRGTPTARQIATWDSLLVPLSRGLDALLGYRLGRSLVAVWSAGEERA
jgi:SAM-dependent methyltransferase